MMKRMTVNGGRQASEKVAFLTEATWQDHTPIFHSHSSVFAKHTAFFQKVPRAPRKPSSKQRTRQFLKSVAPILLTKGPPPPRALLTIVVVIVLLQTREAGSSILLPTMHHFPRRAAPRGVMYEKVSVSGAIHWETWKLNT